MLFGIGNIHKRFPPTIFNNSREISPFPFLIDRGLLLYSTLISTANYMIIWLIFKINLTCSMPSKNYRQDKEVSFIKTFHVRTILAFRHTWERLPGPGDHTVHHFMSNVQQDGVHARKVEGTARPEFKHVNQKIPEHMGLIIMLTTDNPTLDHKLL